MRKIMIYLVFFMIYINLFPISFESNIFFEKSKKIEVGKCNYEDISFQDFMKDISKKTGMELYVVKKRKNDLILFTINENLSLYDLIKEIESKYRLIAIPTSESSAGFSEDCHEADYIFNTNFLNFFKNGMIEIVEENPANSNSDYIKTQIKRKFRAFENDVSAVIIHPNGKYLIVSGDNGWIKVLDWRSECEVKRIKYHNAKINSLDITKDGKYLISCGMDNKVILFDLENNKVVRQMDGTFNRVAFDRDEKNIVLIKGRQYNNEFIVINTNTFESYRVVKEVNFIEKPLADIFNEISSQSGIAFLGEQDRCLVKTNRIELLKGTDINKIFRQLADEYNLFCDIKEYGTKNKEIKIESRNGMIIESFPTSIKGSIYSMDGDNERLWLRLYNNRGTEIGLSIDGKFSFENIYVWGNCILEVSDLKTNVVLKREVFDSFYPNELKIIIPEQIKQSDLENFISAIKTESIEEIKKIISKGISINGKTKSGYYPIDYAIWSKNSEIIDLLIENGAEIKNGDSLLYAIETKNKKLVKMILEEINKNNENISAYFDSRHFFAAVKGNYTDLLSLFLESGTYVDSIDINGKTALMLAAERNNFELVKLLIEKNSNVNLIDNKGKNAIFYAINNEFLNDENREILNLLLKEKSVLLFDIEKDMDMFIKVINKQNIEILRQLINKNLNREYFDKYSRTPVLYAVETGNYEIVKLLIERGFNKDKADIIEISPIFNAIYKGNFEILKLFAESGCNINQKNSIGRTPLYEALNGAKINFEICKYLIENGADINVESNNYGIKNIADGIIYAEQDLLLKESIEHNSEETLDIFLRKCLETAIYSKNLKYVKLIVEHLSISSKKINVSSLLYPAVKYSDIEIIDYLFEKGAKVSETKNIEHIESNLIYIATDRGELNIVKKLINNGIDLAARENEKLIYNAIFSKKKDILEFLLSKGLKINTTNKNDHRWITPVIAAMETDNLEILNMVVKNGGDINEKNNEGETPLIFSLRNSSLKAIEFLLQNGANPNIKDYYGKTFFDNIKELKLCNFKEKAMEIEVFLEKYNIKEGL